MSESCIAIVRGYNFDPKEVIKGLNGYYESDKRNGYITVRRNDVEGPAYFTAALYLSALIEWLREDHDIFYYPGMDIRDSGGPGLTLDQVEAARNAAKTCCLRSYIKDEICKRGLWCDKDTDIPELVDTLFKAYDECKELRDINRKDAVKLSEENRELKESVCKDIMNYIRYEASRNGFELPEENDGEPLTIKRVFHDLLELMRKRGAEIRGLKSGIEDLKEHITLLEADLKKAKMEKEKFLIEVADREEEIESLQNKDYDVYLEHRSSVILRDLYRDIFKKRSDGLSAEDIANRILDRVLTTEDLLHKSVDSVNKECKAVGKQMVDDYEKDLLKFIYKEYKNRTRLSDETITYNPPNICNTITKIISDYTRNRTRVDILETRIKSIFDRCKAKFTVDDYVINSDPTTSFMLDCISAWIDSPAESRGKIKAEIENYKLKLKDYILKDIKEHGYQYDGLETKSIEVIVDWIITMATCTRNEWVDSEIRNLRGQIDRLKGLINAVNEEVKDM